LDGSANPLMIHGLKLHVGSKGLEVRAVEPYTHTHTHTHTHSLTHSLTHLNTYVYTYIHTYTHIQTYTHTYIHRCGQWSPGAQQRSTRSRFLGAMWYKSTCFTSTKVLALQVQKYRKRRSAALVPVFLGRCGTRALLVVQKYLLYKYKSTNSDRASRFVGAMWYALSLISTKSTCLTSTKVLTVTGVGRWCR
jgi:hypothetical protein